MWNSWKVPASEHVDHMMDWIATVAKRATGGKLATLIFNSHGHPGGVSMGMGIGMMETSKFVKLKGLVTEIWIIACTVAQADNPYTSRMSNGEEFCRQIAENAQAYVTAAVKNQSTGTTSIPYGYVDEWEGPVYTWDPKGQPSRRQ
jgi:hypothetical protein